MRFSRYNDEWQTKKLGELAEIIGGGTPSTKNNEYWNGPINWFTPSEITSKYCYDSERTITEEGLNNSSAKMLPINSILITTRATIGLISINKEECSTNQGFQSLILKNQNCEFVYYMLHDYINEMKKLAIGSTFLEISKKDLKKIKVYIPSIDEQNNIACFLSNIDKKIELLRDRKEGFIEFKHYLLQNLFPQNGETVPKLRFNKNVTYEKCQVSDFLRVSELDAVDDINRRLTVKLNLKGIYKREVKPNEKEGATKQYERKAGQFIYGKQNLFKGAFGIIPFELDGFLSSKDLPSFDFNNNIIPQWFYYYFSREDFYKHLENLSNGTGSKRISPEEFLKIQINVPQDKEEQEKIASTLSTIDNKIDLIEKEIELVEEYKKGLLQKMFIWRVVLCLNVVSYSDFLKLLFVINYIKITN